jgi:phage/plasmid-associated DNA primase
MIFHGKGSNGKSLIANMITKVLEDNKFSQVVNSKILSQASKTGEVTHELNSLINRRIAFMEETEKNEKLLEGQVKKMTGTRTLPYRGLYCETSTFTMRAQLILLTNDIPKVSNSYSIMRRLELIPFDATFVDESKLDKNDPSKKLKIPESELEKMIKPEIVLRWLVEGSIDYFKEGLINKPMEVKAFKNDFMKKNDLLQRFVLEELIILDEEDEDSTPLEEIYIKYIQYSGENRRKFTIKDFKDELLESKLIKNMNSKDNHIPVLIR